jgi:hypothetical protein
LTKPRFLSQIFLTKPLHHAKPTRQQRDARDKGKLNVLLFGAVMKKTALALFALLLVAVFQFSNFANANPAPYPTTPNQELPTLSVESPYNEEVFTSDSIRLNFTVTTPDSWNVYWMTSLPIIGEFNVEVYLDGIEKYHEYMVGSQDTLIYNYSIVLDGLTEGKHTAKILITVRTFFQPEHANDARIYLRDFYQTRDFAVQLFPTTLVATASGISVAVVCLGVLVYFKKRKR